MSALMIANITVKNPEKFQLYLSKTQQVASLYGAELLCRGKVDRILTGETNDHQLTVIVKFPSIEIINEWFDSAEYQSLVSLRKEGTDMKMTSYEVNDRD